MFLHTLESHGVRARVFNENLQGGVGELPPVYPEVWVDDERDWDRARALVAQFERPVTRDQGLVRCRHCDEDNPATFEICWRCGTVIVQSEQAHGRAQEKEDR